MAISEEEILASINKLRLAAFELSEKAEGLQRVSEHFSIDEKTKALRQIIEWLTEAESLNKRASELALQMVENTKEPMKHRPTGFFGSYIVF